MIRIEVIKILSLTIFFEEAQVWKKEDQSLVESF